MGKIRKESMKADNSLNPLRVISEKNCSLLKDLVKKNGCSLIAPKKENNSEKERRPLSLNEISGIDNYLMSHIVTIMSKSEEEEEEIGKRRCRNFKTLRKKKSKHIASPFFIDKIPNDKKKFWFTLTWGNSKPFLEVLGNTLAINIPENNSNVTKFLLVRLAVIKISHLEIKNLEIGMLDLKYIKLFKVYDYLSSVETVSLDLNNALPVGMEIFDSCPTLRPKTIRFAVFHQRRSNIQVCSIKDLIRLFPSSVKNIQFYCTPHEVDWFFELSKFLPKQHFETLEFTNYFLSRLLNTPEAKRGMYQLSRCFKNIKVCIQKDVSYNVCQYLYEKLTSFEVFNETKLSFECRFNLIKEWHSPLVSFHDCLVLKDVKSQNVTTAFSYLDHFSVRCDSTWNEPPEGYINPFTRIVTVAKNLKTLELSLKVFKSPKQFETFLKNLSPTLKNLKLCHCDKLTTAFFGILTDACSHIENLSLEQVDLNIISIEKISSSFNNLKGLSITFLPYQNNIKLFDDLVKDIKGEYPERYNLPTVDFLQFIFYEPSYEDKKTVDHIVKVTPDIGNRFTIKFHSETKINFSTALELIVQKEINCYDEFMKLFC